MYVKLIYAITDPGEIHVNIMICSKSDIVTEYLQTLRRIRFLYANYFR
jgi:hypothetical protein